VRFSKLNIIHTILIFALVGCCGLAYSDSSGVIQLEVVLEKYEPAHPWHEERDGGFDDGVAPLAKFVTLKPERFSYREVNVLFNSQHHEEMLPLIEKGVGKSFLIDVLADFFKGNANTIDAMYIPAMELKNP
jgi:hypothetical protein